MQRLKLVLRVWKGFDKPGPGFRCIRLLHAGFVSGGSLEEQLVWWERVNPLGRSEWLGIATSFVQSLQHGSRRIRVLRPTLRTLTVLLPITLVRAPASLSTSLGDLALWRASWKIHSPLTSSRTLAFLLSIIAFFGGSGFAVQHVAKHHFRFVACVAENQFAAHDFEDTGLPLVDHRIGLGSRFALHIAECDFPFILGEVGMD
jgi:hypothetical protein